MWERGLKRFPQTEFDAVGWSLPVWERGLKQISNHKEVTVTRSLPVWERGLKHAHLIQSDGHFCRSPCGSVD